MADVTKLNIGGVDYDIVDASVPSWAKQSTKPTYTANEINGFATVATSGSYNDLSNKPTIPSIGTLNTNNSTAQTANSSESFSGNINLHKVSKTGSYNDLNDKPTIPTVPTNVSSFTNDVGYITSTVITDLTDIL